MTKKKPFINTCRKYLQYSYSDIRKNGFETTRKSPFFFSSVKSVIRMIIVASLRRYGRKNRSKMLCCGHVKHRKIISPSVRHSPHFNDWRLSGRVQGNVFCCKSIYNASAERFVLFCFFNELLTIKIAWKSGKIKTRVFAMNERWRKNKNHSATRKYSCL